MGVGVFAKRDIEAGECILTEEVILVKDVEINGFDQLSGPDREALCALSASPLCLKTSPNCESAILATNCIGPMRKLFPVICRINHSCVPNVQWVPVGSHSVSSNYVRALRNIPAGMELFADYTGNDEKSNDLEELENMHGFKCGCSLCALGATGRADRLRKDSEETQNKEKELELLLDKIGTLARQPKETIDPLVLRALQLCHSVCPWDKDGIAHDMYQLLSVASQYDAALVAQWAVKARDWDVLVQGPFGHKNLLFEYCARHPDARHSSSNEQWNKIRTTYLPK